MWPHVPSHQPVPKRAGSQAVEIAAQRDNVKWLVRMQRNINHHNQPLCRGLQHQAGVRKTRAHHVVDAPDAGLVTPFLPVLRALITQQRRGVQAAGVSLCQYRRSHRHKLVMKEHVPDNIAALLRRLSGRHATFGPSRIEPSRGGIQPGSTSGWAFRNAGRRGGLKPH